MVVFTLITNRPADAGLAHRTGIQRVAIDLERETKIHRQAGCGTFISAHSLEDLERLREHLPHGNLLVRVNSIHSGSAEEFRRLADSAPQSVMLPFFQTLQEVDRFLGLVPKGTAPVLLLESVASLRLLERLLAEYPVGEYFIGLNDLSLDLGNPNFLVTLRDPLFLDAVGRLSAGGLPWGLGGVGDPFDTKLPINTRAFFEYQVAQGADRALFSRNFRILFDRPDAETAVAGAFNELVSLADTVSALDPRTKEATCRRFLEEQTANASLRFYPPR
jgi:hypothetical protein